MAASLDKDERQGLIRRFMSGLKFPQLFAVLLALFAVDLFTPDPIVLVDEAILGVLALMLGMWRRRGEEGQELDNVTPRADRDVR